MDLHHAVMDSFPQDSSPMTQGQGAAMISLRTPLIAATLALAGWAGTAQAQANVTYAAPGAAISVQFGAPPPMRYEADRKSTRLNSSHLVISYAVFCLKKNDAVSVAAPRMSRDRGARCQKSRIPKPCPPLT